MITKILVNRIRPFLDDLISPNQNSFIPGRGSEVNFIIASEIIHSMNKKKGKKGLFPLKLDLEKAYDRLEWSFIEHCLLYFHFSSDSIQLIMSCVSSVSTAIQINGSRTQKFEPSRGIRQGDPLSPYLFILCLEYLSRKIHEACNNKEWAPFRVRRNATKISHLMFADDILLFGEASLSTLTTMNATLHSFFHLSGQKIDESKSMLYFSPNTPMDIKDEFEQELNILSTNDLGTYLGFPLCHRKPSKNKLSFLIDKMASKLSSWKARALSKAGKMILINSTLQSIPRYLMHPIALPASFIAKLDSICSNFFWNGKDNKKKINWIAWKNICKPKSLGGLGCMSNKNINMINLARLCWKLDNDTMWAAKIIHEKYVNNKDYPTSFKRGSHIWKSIGLGWDLYKNSLAWKIGNGESINLWNDKWLLGENLRSTVQGPLLPHELDLKLSSLKDNDILRISSINIPAETLIKIRNTQFINKNDETYCLWTKNSLFSSKMALDSILDSPKDGSWDWIWKCPGYLKMRFLFWQIWWGRMPSNVNINMRIPNVNKFCNFCHYMEEDMNHILRVCATEIWAGLKLKNCLSTTFNEWLKTNLSECVISSLANLPVNVIFGFAIWFIWIRRNSWVF